MLLDLILQFLIGELELRFDKADVDLPTDDDPQPSIGFIIRFNEDWNQATSSLEGIVCFRLTIDTLLVHSGHTDQHILGVLNSVRHPSHGRSTQTISI